MSDFQSLIQRIASGHRACRPRLKLFAFEDGSATVRPEPAPERWIVRESSPLQPGSRPGLARRRRSPLR